VSRFLSAMATDPWDVKDLGRKTGVPNPPPTERILTELSQYFGVGLG